MIFINNQSDFDQVCRDLLHEKILYMDTEFDRRKTYYAILSIIQISSSKQKIVIDALSKINLFNLKEILISNNILKVFHSPDQDLGILLRLFGILPRNIFDTQIAANVCGMAQGMGYRSLCKIMLNTDIDKSLQKSNWLERPLPQKLLEYAIRDTEFLIPLHRILFETLTVRKLWDNYNARSAKLLHTDEYKFVPEKIISKMRLSNLSPNLLNNLTHFTALREECAQILNIPRNYCASDKDIMAFATYLPESNERLMSLRLNSLAMSKSQFKNKIFNLSAGLKSLKI